jgi:hypothetical protein
MAIRISILCLGILAGAVAWSLGSTTAGSARDAEACWLHFAFLLKEPAATDGRDDADELICIYSATEGYVLESPGGTLGTGVKGCNKVTVKSGGGRLLLNVDYSECTNNAPSHTISCPSIGGNTLKCVDSTWRETYLRSCPKHWCNRPGQ